MIFYCVVQNGFFNLIKFFVNSGVLIEMLDFEGRIVFCVVLERGNYDCVELLLRFGVNVNFVMKGGKIILY